MAHHGKLAEASQYLIARMRSAPARTACIGDCMGGRRLIRHPASGIACEREELGRRARTARWPQPHRLLEPAARAAAAAGRG
jgi:hypothetical protein